MKKRRNKSFASSARKLKFLRRAPNQRHSPYFFSIEFGHHFSIARRALLCLARQCSDRRLVTYTLNGPRGR